MQISFSWFWGTHVSVMSVGSIPVLWGPWGDRLIHIPLNPALPSSSADVKNAWSFYLHCPIYHPVVVLRLRDSFTSHWIRLVQLIYNIVTSLLPFHSELKSVFGMSYEFQAKWLHSVGSVRLGRSQWRVSSGMNFMIFFKILAPNFLGGRERDGLEMSGKSSVMIDYYHRVTHSLTFSDLFRISTCSECILYMVLFLPVH
jgi:hypothetical protein